MSEKKFFLRRDHSDACLYFPDLMAQEIKGCLPEDQWLVFLELLAKNRSEKFIREVRQLLVIAA